MKSMKILVNSLLLLLLSSITAQANTLDEDIHDLQQQWAVVNYETDEKQLDKAFEQLTLKAEQVVASYPDKAEPLIWNAIIVSSHAGKSGGLGALSKVKKSKKLLLKAEKINPTALHGSIYTSLGSLYYQVPGWPLGFGDDEKAEQYLKKALSINPTGIDPNYFYGDFLLEEGKYKESENFLQKALNAPKRPDRPLADKGRKIEIEAKLKKVKSYL